MSSTTAWEKFSSWMTGSVIPAVISMHGNFLHLRLPHFLNRIFVRKYEQVSILQQKRSMRGLFFYSHIDQCSCDDRNKSNERLCPLLFEKIARKSAKKIFRLLSKQRIVSSNHFCVENDNFQINVWGNFSKIDQTSKKLFLSSNKIPC